MMLTDDQLRKVEEAIDDQKAGRKKRKATIYESQRWSYKIIPYVIESSSSKFLTSIFWSNDRNSAFMIIVFTVALMRDVYQ